MAVYLTAAKKAEIVKDYQFALPTKSLDNLLDEIAAAIAQAGVVELQEEIALADFTDNDDTTGTYEFASDIPAGALVLGVIVSEVVGFAGDTSAVMTLGDGTDVDRYNTGTPNVFAAADFLDMGAISGVAFHAAAKTPTIIITSAADFSSVSAGSMKVSIFYIVQD